jgi:predicted transcriptional regulator
MARVRMSIDLDDETVDALDRMVADMDLDFPREVAAAAALRDWLFAAGYFLMT